MGFNVLFQDADIVWFRNPFEFFHNDMTMSAEKGLKVPHGYFSDDGQRGSPRYAPFFANSGFFYLRNSPEMRNLAYSIMLGFDTMQSTGSHQNVFTVRLMEGLDMFGLWPVAVGPKNMPTLIQNMKLTRGMHTHTTKFRTRMAMLNTRIQ